MRRWVGLVIILLIACFSYAAYADDLWDHRHGEKRDVRAARVIEGRWSINANNHTGTLEISWSGDQYRGRVYFDDYQRWETLTNIQFDDLSRTIGFDRPEKKQHYAGRLIKADVLEGSFSGGYGWRAKRM